MKICNWLNVFFWGGREDMKKVICLLVGGMSMMTGNNR